MPHVILTMAWDAGNRRTSLAAEVDSTADFLNTYTYDNLGRMTRVTQDGQSGGNSVEEKRVDLAYSALGQYASITRYADVAGTLLVATTTYTFDDAYRLTELEHAQNSTSLAEYTWTYDTAGRLTAESNPDGTVDYTYDDLGQLTAADRSSGPDETYTYDENGNRTNTGYSTGDANRLLSDGTYNYTYDDEGNRTKKTTISSGDYVEYAWDHRNRLTTVTYRTSAHAKTKEVFYTYDAFNRRIAKDVDTDGDGDIDTGERYVYDDQPGMLDPVVLVFDASGNLQTRALNGPSVDQLFASETDTGDVFWTLTDHQGTVRDIAEYDATSGDTEIVNHIRYGAFGNITSQTDPATSTTPTNPDVLLATFRTSYTGREWDADAALFYYRARWYDPMAGRFISEDPIGFNGGDVNLQRYVNNSSINWIDPTGLDVKPPINGGDGFYYIHVYSSAGWFTASEWMATIKYPTTGGHHDSNRDISEEMAKRLMNEHRVQVVQAIVINAVAQAPDVAVRTLAPPVDLALDVKDFACDPSLTKAAAIGLPAIAGGLKKAATVADLTKVKGMSRVQSAVESAQNQQQLVHSLSKVDTRGGTYKLVDPETGEVMRTGRTKDLTRRKAEHARDPILKDYDFEVDKMTDNYDQQRGREQILDDRYNPPLNHIRPIRPDHPKLLQYMDAAKQMEEITPR